MLKKTIVILFGSGHKGYENSLLIANSMVSNIDTDKFFSLPIGISEEGMWLMYQGNATNILNGDWKKFATPAVLSPDVSHKGILKISGDRVKMIPVDIIISTFAQDTSKNASLESIARLAEIQFFTADEQSVNYIDTQMREYIETICYERNIQEEE